MISFDTNILFYSLNPQSKHHELAASALTAALGDQRVIISDYVLVKLYNLLRNPTVMATPLDAAEATQVVTSYLRHSNVTRAENAPIMDQVWEMSTKAGFARRRIFDLRLGFTLLHHGVTEFVTANVKDFSDVGFEKVWSPLKTA